MPNRLPDFLSSVYYENRELSWIAFNQRVLDEAADAANPLFERLKFLAIVYSNLDEFYMVRVGSLNDQIDAGYTKPDASGLTPKAQLEAINKRVHDMMEDAGLVWTRRLVPALRRHHIHFVKQDELTVKQEEWLSRYFDNFVYPVLTPMAVDSGRPFPLIQNKSLNIGVLVKSSEEEDETVFASVQVPSVLSRFVTVPGNEVDSAFMLLEDLIAMYMDRLFIGKKILATATYRVTRNGDLAIDEDEAEDLLIEIEKSIRQRRWGQAVRLEYDRKADERMVDILREELELDEADTFACASPVDLTFLFRLYNMDVGAELKYIPHKAPIPPGLMDTSNLFASIREKDILLHHPYESFTPIIELIRQAARDPKVLAIKQTLYRVSGKSPLVRALAEAAENGKQVTVLVELKARFDEENNIQWAKRLEKAGCHVIYGLIGLKTHSKITLIVRMEDEGIQRYVHLSTGNYNDVTANIYTDLGLLTCDKYFGEDASAVFNALSGYSDHPHLNKLVMAPIRLRETFVRLIERERDNALAGKPAFIRAKLNSLVDTGIIECLYQASYAGVKIDLLVRGMCSMKVGIPHVSENITVRSIVGRFLEHSRIYQFHNNGDNALFLSSADWMERNMDRRVELLYPIEDKKIRKRVLDLLDLYFSDTEKTRILDENGKYHPVKCKAKNAVNAQEIFIERAYKRAADAMPIQESGVFLPKTNASLQQNISDTMI